MQSTSSLVLRTIYIDDYLDKALVDHARATGQAKADVFRRWLDVGIRAVRGGHRAPSSVPAPTSPLILKTVHLSPKVDQFLRVEAFDSHVKQNDVLRRYVQAGLEISLRDARSG